MHCVFAFCEIVTLDARENINAKCTVCFALYFMEKKLGGARDRQAECQWCAAVVPPTAVRSAWRLSDWLSSSWLMPQCQYPNGHLRSAKNISKSRVSVVCCSRAANTNLSALRSVRRLSEPLSPGAEHTTLAEKDQSLKCEIRQKIVRSAKRLAFTQLVGSEIIIPYQSK